MRSGVGLSSTMRSVWLLQSWSRGKRDFPAKRPMVPYFREHATLRVSRPAAAFQLVQRQAEGDVNFIQGRSRATVNVQNVGGAVEAGAQFDDRAGYRHRVKEQLERLPFFSSGNLAGKNISRPPSHFSVKKPPDSERRRVERHGAIHLQLHFRRHRAGLDKRRGHPPKSPFACIHKKLG